MFTVGKLALICGILWAVDTFGLMDWVGTLDVTTGLLEAFIFKSCLLGSFSQIG